MFSKIIQNINWLIVGLGNPGEIYDETRHNIGFMVAITLCKKYKAKIKKGSPIYYYTVFQIEDQTIMVAFPITYMNLSGEAVRKIKEKYDIPIDKILIICDEYNFPVGKVHLKNDGSDGGHNGVSSVIEELRETNFLRLRCGIGKNFPMGGMVNYVLSPFPQDEITERDNMITKAVESIEYLIRNGIVKAMTDINSEKLW